MKIKVITRSLDDHLPSSSSHPHPVQRNLAPHLHPFSKPLELTRAITAAKMDRMFSQPFVGALEGWSDGVYCLAKDARRVGVVAGGGGDGEIIIQSLPLRRPILKLPSAHRGLISGLTWSSTTLDTSRLLLSCGAQDMSIKIWSSPLIAGSITKSTQGTERGEEGWGGNPHAEEGQGQGMGGMLDEEQREEEWEEEEGGGMAVDEEKRRKIGESIKPLMVYQGKNGFNAIDHHRHTSTFASASNTVQLWSPTTSVPLTTMAFGSSAETVTSVKFNQSETDVLASIGGDRTLCLYDVRTGRAERRLVMAMKSNALSWCPTLPTVLLLASEDHNLYTFDIRKLESPTQVYKGHVGAVMGCDWSPTGEEFVSGSYDRTIRLWNRDQGKSRDVYHTKRMQRVFATTFTPTADFILSASDDGNVRIWKSDASKKLGPVDARERQAGEYRKKLREKWGGEKGVREIERKRRLPQSIKKATTLKATMLDARKTKDDNRRKHTREGEAKPRAERKKIIVAEQK